MNRFIRQPNSWYQDIIALLSGTLIPLSLAPYDLWPLGIISAGILALLLQNIAPKKRFFRSFLFGIGLFGKGASWVYVSIHDFGYTSPPLAVVMTGAFVLGLAFVFAAPFLLFSRKFSASTWGYVLAFPAIWVLGEWTRSWFLTGFPWLYLGYAHIETWLSGWAPVFGVFGVSFCCAISGSWLTCTASKIIKQKPLLELAPATACLAAIWLLGYLLFEKEWKPEGDNTISVAMVQPNVPLEVKWNPLFRDDIMNILREETQQHWDKDLIIWPEAAVPLLYSEASYFFEEMSQRARDNNTGIITGILYDKETEDRLTIYNSIVGLGRADGVYFKQRLVPFGEYVPLENWLRGLIAFFDLPNSTSSPGPREQDILSFDTIKIAPSICYEIVYPDLVARLSQDASLIVTISNDAWFGASIGPMQHFQMAQMRALENRRYVLRSTNTGISGFINPLGQVTTLGKQFNRESIEQLELDLVNSSTLFAFWGSIPVVMFCLAILGVLSFVHLRQRQNHIVNIPD